METRRMFGLFQGDTLKVIAAKEQTLEMYQHTAERGVIREVDVSFEQALICQAQEVGLWTWVYQKQDRAFYRLWKKKFLVEMESYDFYTSALLKGEGYFAKVQYTEVAATG